MGFCTIFLLEDRRLFHYVTSMASNGWKTLKIKIKYMSVFICNIVLKLNRNLFLNFLKEVHPFVS